MDNFSSSYLHHYQPILVLDCHMLPSITPLLDYFNFRGRSGGTPVRAQKRIQGQLGKGSWASFVCFI